MKSRFLVIISALILLCSCDNNPFDYRNKYTGDWGFKVRKTETGTQYPGYYNQQDITYSGRIDHGSSGDLIIIRFLSDKKVEIGVNKNGTYFNLPPQFAINFSADGNFVNFSWKDGYDEANTEFIVSGQRK